jgi:DNA-directed RNA polymerase specialized sigma24 family protein
LIRKVVVKHEALAVRRARAGVAGVEVDLDAVSAVAQRTIEERLESAERVERSAETMRRLKRDEARALMLKAEGLPYVEIGERLGWTYTKVSVRFGRTPALSRRRQRNGERRHPPRLPPARRSA